MPVEGRLEVLVPEAPERPDPGVRRRPVCPRASWAGAPAPLVALPSSVGAEARMVSLGLATQGTQGDVVELAGRRLYRCLRPRQLEGFCEIREFSNVGCSDLFILTFECTLARHCNFF